MDAWGQNVTSLLENVGLTAEADSALDINDDTKSLEEGQEVQQQYDEVSTTVCFREGTELGSGLRCVILSDDLHMSDNGTPVNLEYLNEGGANLIFRFVNPNRETDLPSKLRGNLLRLPKFPIDPPKEFMNPAAYFDIPAMEQHRSWVDILGRKAVLSLQPVIMCPSLEKLINYHLKNAARAESRQSTAWEGGRVGFLIKDMTAGEGEELYEFKPKWLAQSPTAPRHARRCRTCALRAKRAATNVVTSTDRQSICPLYLLTVLAQRHVERFTNKPRQLNFITKHALPVLKKLREHQISNDPLGVLVRDCIREPHDDAITRNEKLAHAMTSRDCTIYGRYKRNGTVEVRVGDLDLKPIESGRPKWYAIENALRNEGWYDGQDDICLLSNDEDVATVKSTYEPGLRKAVFGWTDGDAIIDID